MQKMNRHTDLLRLVGTTGIIIAILIVSQSQCSVERANGDVEEIIFTWMSDNETTQWSIGLLFVQFMKNRSYHSGIRQSPYEAMFGQPAKVGLEHLSLPTAVAKHIRTEEELEMCVKNTSTIMQRPPTTPVAEEQPPAKTSVSCEHATTAVSEHDCDTISETCQTSTTPIS